MATVLVVSAWVQDVCVGGCLANLEIVEGHWVVAGMSTGALDWTTNR